MSFNISFLNETTEDNNEVCNIKIGAFTEDLIIPTVHWSRKQYEDQWKRSLNSIVKGDSISSSGLITEIYPEGSVDYVNIWPIYREGNEIYIQNRLIFLDKNPDFKQENLTDYIGERESVDSEGNHISEWKVSLDDIKSWLSENSL